MRSIVTFNLRTLVPMDGINYFPNRLPLIKKKIAHEQPDIIGFQEMMPEMLAAMRGIMPDYYFIGTGRGSNLDNESNNIAIKKSEFEICACDTEC